MTPEGAWVIVVIPSCRPVARWGLGNAPLGKVQAGRLRPVASMAIMSDELTKLLSIRDTVFTPLAERLGVELGPRAAISAPPTVLILGNHSSGKSSFINHLLGESVQRTGVAPTDDGFTVLLHDEHERNVDGATLTTTPDLPFAGLARMGPGLVQHLYGRYRKARLLKHVRLIDSPGMIDAAGLHADRPYDFMRAVRWLAEHADLILLFFDPEKPGTTSETLSALNEALGGVEHKLHIVMNKMDLFEGIRDFARTYGTLCWNLSRALRTKDIPHIYTTVIPELSRPSQTLPLDDFASALLELERFIVELPSRRLDRVITCAIDEGQRLLVQVRVAADVRGQLLRSLRRITLWVLLFAALGAAGAWLRWGEQPWLGGAAAGAVAIAIVGLGWIWRWSARRHRSKVLLSNLDLSFRRACRADLARREHSDDLFHAWSLARPGLSRALAEGGLARLSRIPARLLRKLEQAINKDLPDLR